MELNVRGKSLDITPALQQYVEKHTGKIQRYFGKPIQLNMLLSVVKGTQIAEATVFIDGVIIRAVEKTDDMYKSIDLVFDKIERQIHKYKTRLAKRFKGREVLNETLPQPEIRVPQEEAKETFHVVKRKVFDMKPMTVDEAILQMNLLDHDFFVFQNAETEKAAVVYRRKDDQYGLIDAQM